MSYIVIEIEPNNKLPLNEWHDFIDGRIKYNKSRGAKLIYMLNNNDMSTMVFELPYDTITNRVVEDITTGGCTITNNETIKSISKEQLNKVIHDIEGITSNKNIFIPVPGTTRWS